MKKTLAILLSLALVVCMIPTTASVALATGGVGSVTIGQDSVSKEYGVTVSETAYTYDGQIKKPSVNLGSDAPAYDVSYRLKGSGNVSELKNAGIYEILITVNGGSQTFAVTECTIEIAKATSSGITIKKNANKELTSDNNDIISNPYNYFEVYDGDIKLEAGEDGDVILNCIYDSNNGAYNVTATSTNRNYNIFNIPSTFTVTTDTKDLAASTLTNSRNFTYNGSAQAPNFTVQVGTTIVDPSYYTVKYKLNGSALASTETKPINAGTYDVEITAKPSNRDDFTGYKNFTSAFKIEPLDINSSSISAFYMGTPGTNPVKLQFNSSTLTFGADYAVELKKSSYNYYIVTGKGNFKGTRNVYTEIRNLSKFRIDFSDNRSSKAYGSTYYPKVTVYDYINGKTIRLSENTDYEITYKNSKNQIVDYCKDTGTYSVIVTGKGPYIGTVPLNFEITGTDIKKYTVTLKAPSANVTGYSITPEIKSVTYGYYSSLTANDYTVTYQDENGKTVNAMSVPGTYKVVVTGKNGYSGSTYATFRIVGKPQTVTVDKDSYKKYPTSDYFKITASATGDGTGFTYTSSNPAVASVSSTGYVTTHNIGTAVITVATTGNQMSEPTSKEVIVKVYPNRAKISNKPWTAGKKAQLKVRWGYQDGVTKYQVRYSRDKNFKAGTYLTKTVKAHGKDYTTQSTTLTKLKRGYTYYVKVRAVYTDPVTGDNYYGSWSGWRSAKTI